MRYYIVAGERSGDLHGGNLIRSIRKHDDQAQFRVWGGEYMKEAGGDLVVHYNNLAFMGFIEVLLYFRKILKYLRFCKEDIRQFNPDVVVLIDFGGFNLRIAKHLKKSGVRVFYYISPKVWAWNTKRALKIKASVDKMFVILPFEKDFYMKYEFEVDYVGNPVVDAIVAHNPNPSFLREHNLNDKDQYIALLPGSRKQELESILPNMVALAKDMPDMQFILAGIGTADYNQYAPCLEAKNILVIMDRTYDILAYAHAAVVTSGTATLETALWNVPQVVVYRSNSYISLIIAGLVIQVPFISLVNLIAGRKVVDELIQWKLTRKSLQAAIKPLIGDSPERKAVLDGYAEIKRILGDDPVSDTAAQLMVKYLRN